MSERYAWACDMLDFAYTPMSMERTEKLTEDSPTVVAGGKHMGGEHYDESAFEPVAKWDKSLQGYSRKLPHVFHCNGFTVVSAKAHDVFVAHDMGSATFRQLRLYNADGTTLYSDQLYFLNFGDQKEAFIPEMSPKLRVVDYQLNENFKALPFLKQRTDDQVVLNCAALEGADLWTDPLLFGGVFFSDRLHDAMRKARIDKPFQLSRCLIKA